MDWVGWGTFAAALVAALAAVWAALVSHRQLRLASRQAELPEPTIEANVAAMKGQPEWSELRLVVRNHAPVAVDLVSAAVFRPKATKALARTDALVLGDHGIDVWLNPLPPEQTSCEVALDLRIERSGTNGYLGQQDVVRVQIAVHCPLHRFQRDGRSSVRVRLRWRDQAAKQFTIAARLISPRMTASET